LSPAIDAFLLTNKSEETVTFKWNSPEDVKSVGLEVSKDSSFKQKLVNKNFSDQESFLQKLPGGEYFWRLSANYEGIDKAIVSKAFRFSVANKPKVALKINWQPMVENGPQYFVQKAQMNLAWQVDIKDQAKKWKVRVWPAADGREPSSDSESVVDTQKMQAQAEVAGAGKYNAIVEAYNENDVLLASSEIKTIEMALKPNLKAPLFEPQVGDLKADNHGNLSLLWTKLGEAKEYQLTLRDKDGKELKKGRFLANTTSLVNLMPGQYQVDVYAVDQFGRESDHSVARKVIVPDTSGLKAPKLKKVQVN
jgi:hypothetical protein